VHARNDYDDDVKWTQTDHVIHQLTLKRVQKMKLKMFKINQQDATKRLSKNKLQRNSINCGTDQYTPQRVGEAEDNELHSISNSKQV